MWVFPLFLFIGMNEFRLIVNLLLKAPEGGSSGTSRSYDDAKQGKKQPASYSYSNDNQYSSNKSSGGWSFFTYLLILVFIVGGGYAGWVIYNMSKEKSYKRF